MNNLINRAKNRTGDDAGFTLIELLLVIVVLGVLAGVVVFSVRGIDDKGEVAACKSEVKTAAVAEEAYYAQKGSYADLTVLKGAKLLRGDLKYVTGASATDGSLTLTGAPAGCSAA